MIRSTRGRVTIGKWGCVVIDIMVRRGATVGDVVEWLASCPWNQPYGRVALQINGAATRLVRDAIVCGLSGVGFTEIMVPIGWDWVTIGGKNYAAIGTRYPTLSLVEQEGTA